MSNISWGGGVETARVVGRSLKSGRLRRGKFLGEEHLSPSPPLQLWCLGSAVGSPTGEVYHQSLFDVFWRSKNASGDNSFCHNLHSCGFIWPTVTPNNSNTYMTSAVLSTRHFAASNHAAVGTVSLLAWVAFVSDDCLLYSDTRSMNSAIAVYSIGLLNIDAAN